MEKFKIKIYNGSDFLTYCTVIEAKNGNEAIIKVLQDITIFDLDTITIEAL